MLLASCQRDCSLEGHLGPQDRPFHVLLLSVVSWRYFMFRKSFKGQRIRVLDVRSEGLVAASLSP